MDVKKTKHIDDKIKFFIVDDKKEYIELGVFGQKQTIKIKKNQLELLISSLQNFHRMLLLP